jgi:FKBP-type peptidyl-prolyl cis-trans isomerase
MLAFLIVQSALSTLSLTPDGGVLKTVVREGDGAHPRSQQGVVIDYTGFLADGTMFDSSRNRAHFTFTLGRGVISGWSIGVESMRVGELANFTFDYPYGYGERGYPPVVPAKERLNFQIELLGVE